MTLVASMSPTSSHARRRKASRRFASGRDWHDAPDSRDRGLDIGDWFDGAAIALPVELRAVGIEPMRVGATFVLEAR